MDWLALAQAPLMQVQAALRLLQSDIGTLDCVVALITHCLDRRSLAFAARTGDVRLFRVFAGRRDPQLHESLWEHAVACSMKAAIKNNDLSMVRTIHEIHPTPLVVQSLKAAMKYGSLEMVQWVIENRHDQLCCQSGVNNLCQACLKNSVRVLGDRDACRIVRWLFDRGLLLAGEARVLADHSLSSALASSVELAQWFQDSGNLTQSTAERVLEAAITRASPRNLKLIRYLVENWITVVEETLIPLMVRVSLQQKSQKVVEYVVDSRLCYLFRHQFDHASARPGGAKFIQLKPFFLTVECRDIYKRYSEGIRWLYGQFPSLRVRVADIIERREPELLDLYAWMDAKRVGVWSSDVMDKAAGRGFLHVVQWLDANRSEGCTKAAMDDAAANGHLRVVQWLHLHRTEGCSAKAMDRAAENGHLHVVRWLCEHRTEVSTTKAMIAAATFGQLPVVAWLHKNRELRPDAVRHDGCALCVFRFILQHPYSGRGTDEPSNVPVLNVVHWLEAQLPEECCQGLCVTQWRLSPTLFEAAQWRLSPTLFQAAIKAADMQLYRFLASNDRDAAFARVGVMRSDWLFTPIGHRPHGQ